VIVTKNLADFLANVPGQNNIAAQHPDALITHLLNLDTPDAVAFLRKWQQLL